MNLPEILAPAGSFKSLIAAVESGANAIYLGGKRFSARANAGNFDDQELIEAIDYAHIRGVKIYVTINTLYKDSEIPQLMDFVSYLYKIGADGLILQDLGIAPLIKDNYPDIEIHGSTQMTIHNTEGAQVLKELGFDRVVLSRELSLKEIKQIKEGTDIGLETFIHGALCICYSGQCLMSSMIGGRSGNRGRCAQPCRKEYSLYKNKDIIAQGYLLSPKDLCTADIIEKLVECGIISFKIEGRMKRPEYVGVVVSTYRKILDSLYDNIDINSMKKNLMQIFNRGFTQGYYLNHPENLISNYSPKNQGVFLGEVTSVNKNSINIKLSEQLNIGDGIEFSDKGGIVTKIKHREREVLTGYKGQIVEIFGVKGGVKGDKVYKTSDSLQLAEAQKFFDGNIIRRVPVNMFFKGRLDELPVLTLIDDSGNTVIQSGDCTIQKGIKKCTGIEEIKEKLFQINDIPYEIKEFKWDIDEGIFIPISIIKEMRRNAFNEMTEIRRIKWKRAEIKWTIQEYAPSPILHIKQNPFVSVKVRNFDEFRKVLIANPDEIIINGYYLNDFSNETLNDFYEQCFRENIKLTIGLPPILHQDKMDGIANRIEGLRKAGINRFLIGNIGQIKLFDNEVELYGDYSLNIFNNYTVKLMKGLGLKRICPSLELNLNELKVISDAGILPLEMIVHGHIPVMFTAYHINEGGSHIKDSKGARFPLEVRKGYGTIIYNSSPLVMVNNIRDLLNLNPIAFRIENSLNYDIGGVVKLYKDLLTGKDININFKNFTKGHYYRGVE